MKKNEITKIIEAALRQGSKMPGLFDLPKVLSIKNQLESCNSTDDCIEIIEEHHDLLTKAFGLNQDVISTTVDKIKALKAIN